MADPELKVIVSAVDQASSVLNNLSGNLKSMATDFAKLGAALTAIGGGITALLTICTKAAAEQDVGIQRLAITLKTVGVNYDTVKDSLEANITATQIKTGISDTQQRDMLSRLVLVTQDYKKALDLLPTALDLAAIGGMDAASAATYLAKAYLDLANGAQTVGIRLGYTTVQFKSLEDIENRVRGAAEAMANPFDVLKTRISDLKETIGETLMPELQKLLNVFLPIIESIIKWISAHPTLVRCIAEFGLAVAVAGAALLAFAGAMAFIWAVTLVGLPAVLTAAAAAVGAIAAIEYAAHMGTTPTAPISGRTIEETLTKEAMSKLYAPSYQYGGIVAGGPLGSPKLVMAHVGEEFAGVGRRIGSEIHVHVGTLIADEVTLRNFGLKLKQIIMEDERRTSFPQVNRGYFYGRGGV